MTPAVTPCPDCGAARQSGASCEQFLHQMLFWEAENPAFGVVHHLAVLCYHLQHPHLYSPETLRAGLEMLVGFVEQGQTPQAVRQRLSASVDSGVRRHKITGTPESHGVYTYPVKWTMTAADVVAGGAPRYCEQVRLWAASLLAALRESGNLPTAG